VRGTSFACDFCRDKKKRCDGLAPCNNCTKHVGARCTYLSANQRQRGRTDLFKIQDRLYDVGTRRRFFNAYVEGFFAPAVLFQTTRLSLTNFDCPTTKPLKLQYYTILAGAARAFGSPPSVYGVLEQQARAAARESLQEFNHESALGFHMLCMHYWGSDPDLCGHYRDITLSICERALAKPENLRDVHKLVALNLVTIGIQENDADKPLLQQHNRRKMDNAIQAHSPHCSIDQLPVGDFTNFAQFQALMTSHLLGSKEDQVYYFNELEENCYLQFSKTLKGVVNKLRAERTSSPTVLLTTALDEFLMGLADYMKDSQDPLDHLERAVEIFTVNENLMGFSGPRFIAIFDSAFKVAFLEHKYLLAEKIAKLQQRQAQFFPAARTFAEDNDNMLRQSNHNDFRIEEVTETNEGFTTVPISSNVFERGSADPFGSSVQFHLPVIRHSDG